MVNFFGIIAGVFTAYGALALSDGESDVKETHFYGIGSAQLVSEAVTPWVSPISEELALAMTADGEPFNATRVVEGTSNPNHDLYILSTQGDPARYLGSIDVGKFVTEGAHPQGLTSHRILDMMVMKKAKQDGVHQLLLSFAATNISENCRTNNLALISFTTNQQQGEVKFDGEILFESTCFQAQSPEQKNLSGLGGRIAVLHPTEQTTTRDLEVLLTVGDYVPIPGRASSFSHPVRTHSGSVLNIKRSRTKVLVSGLRNPQGIALVEIRPGRFEVLTSEHGPRGGDEINVIQEGLDYGWPDYSYGTSYGPSTLSDKPNNEGSSGDSTLPFFSWLPSIAPSQILQVQGPEFEKWWGVNSEGQRLGDVLVSSLGAQSLYRLRIEGGVVRYVEAIPIGERIRSFAQLPSGKLLLGTDSGKVLLLSRVSEWDESAGDFEPVDTKGRG
jgi:hypothetical protein